MHTSLRKEMTSIQRAWQRVLRHRRFINGPEVDALERRIARWLRWKYAIGCNSGFGAHLLTLLSMGIGPGRVVAVPAFGPYSFAGALLRRQAHPAFLDISETTLNIDLECLQPSKSTTYDAIVLHDLFGGVAPVADVFIHLPGVPIVEVMTHAFGAMASAPHGAHALVATACLRDSGTMAAYGDAGVVCTDDAELATRLRYIRSELNESESHEGIESGNFHQDTVHAAILLEQWEQRLRRLRRLSSQIRECAAAIENLALPDVRVPRLYSARATHLVILVNHRELLMQHLKMKGIDARIWWPTPLHLQSGFKNLGYREGELPVAERVARENVEIVVDSPSFKLERITTALSQFYVR